MKSKACCTWETFHDGFLAIWDSGCSPRSPTPPRELIDWDLAKRHWQRYAMTGGEAARMQLQALSDDVPHSYRNPWGWLHGPSGDNGEGGFRVDPHTPPPEPLCPVIVRTDRN